MGYIDDLKTEITTDPLIRGYIGMTDAQVAADLNTVYRDAVGSVADLIRYCIVEKNRTNTGTDTTPLFIYGRLELVADAAENADPFGSGILLTIEHITSAKALRAVLNLPDHFSLSFVDARFDEILTDIRQAGVIGAQDKTAILALSQNQQSRASELGFSKVKEGHVSQARAA